MRVKNLELETCLVIECKKDTKNAWIFFTRPFEFQSEDIAGQYLDELQMATKNTEYTEIMGIIMKNARLHYRDMRRVAVTSDLVPLYPSKDYSPQHKSQQRNRKKNPIFAAQNQLKKYIDWALDQDIRNRSHVLPFSIEMYFPCLFFQGHMYEAIVENDGKVKLEKKNHIVLETLLRSPYSVYERNLLIDIVGDSHFNEDHFKNYQELVRKDMISLEKVISQNSEEIGRKISDTLELIESARSKE